MKALFQIAGSGGGALGTLYGVSLAINHFFSVDVLLWPKWLLYLIIAIIVIAAMTISFVLFGAGGTGIPPVDPTVGVITGAVGGVIAGSIVGLVAYIAIKRSL